MIADYGRQFMAVLLGIAISMASPEMLSGYQANPTPSGYESPTEPAPKSAKDLQALVAPIALYPDALVAQILAASTFPDQVAVADYWIDQNKSLTGNALMQAADKQSWDPSVKALTQFPSVLHNLATNLSWTSSLGEAYHYQQAEVMTAIQTLRAQAKAAGNLKSGSQITVVQQEPTTIVIQPANPQVVYVPQYNPAVVYGTTYVTPGYSAGDVAAAGIIGFGAGIAVGALMSGGGCCSWGWSSWNCGWHGTAVVYHGGAYYGNAAWHGGYYSGGYHYNNSYNRVGNNYSNYNRSVNENRNISGNTVNVNHPGNTGSFSNRSAEQNSWAQHNNGGKSNAFSGMDGGHGNGSGNSGGWSSRAESNRGWGSMRSSGFGGGRFGGGGARGGGGFRR